MSKGNNKRGNKEIKKPKQVKAPVLATAGSAANKSSLNIGRKSPK
ncbi:hypothetical protein [Sneathiella sp. HT1-7]|nr:hypothetical protein [Sneathiella sp. HT1-7]